MLRRAMGIATLFVAACCGLWAYSFEEASDGQRKSIEKGVQWLLKAQNKDGSWGLDSKDSQSDPTCTALAGLVLLSDGNTERDGLSNEKVKAIRGAVEFILTRARKAKDDISMSQTSLIQGKLGHTVHNHFAVVFLTQVYGMRTGDLDLSDEVNAVLKPTIQKLTDYIARTQDPDGSWHKNTFGSLKATCMAWVALRSAGGTGVPINGAKLDKTLQFIKKSYSNSTKLFHLEGRGGGYGDYQTMYATSSAIRVLQGSGLGNENMTLNAIDEFIKQCKDGQWKQMFLTVEGEDYLAAMMMTHALVSENGERWKKWYPFIRDSLVKRQNADGSWTTTACISGRTFASACALLSLTTPNRLLPIQE